VKPLVMTLNLAGWDRLLADLRRPQIPKELMTPIVVYYTAEGPTPALVLRETAPEVMKLFVFHQTGRTETIERVPRTKEPKGVRGSWNYMEEPELLPLTANDIADFRKEPAEYKPSKAMILPMGMEIEDVDMAPRQKDLRPGGDRDSADPFEHLGSSPEW